MNGYALSNKRNRKLFAALTNKELEKCHWWKEYSESVTKRNKVVHEAQIASLEEAQKAIDSSTGMIKELGQWS